MAQYSTIINNGSGFTVRTALNQALQTLLTNNSGSSEPSSPVAFQLWIDTSGVNPLIKERNSNNDAWITIGNLVGSSFIPEGLDAKADLVATPTSGNILLTDVNGNPVDSGKKFGTGSGDVPVNSQIIVGLPTNYISKGLNLSNNSLTPNTKIDISAGKCRSDDDTVDLILSAGTIDATTVGLNGIDTGALASGTWYHVFASSKNDGSDAGFLLSTSLTPAYPYGYTKKKYLGSVKTDSSSHIIPFIQKNNYFYWKTPVQDGHSVTPGDANRHLVTLSIPAGIRTIPLTHINMQPAGASNWTYGLITSPDAADTAPTSSLYNIISFYNSSATPDMRSGCFDGQIISNTSSQIAYRLSQNAGSLDFCTSGYIDIER